MRNRLLLRILPGVLFGALVLVISNKPLLANIQIMTPIQYTAADVNRSQKPGTDSDMGYGRINLQTLLSPYNLD